MPVLVDAKDMRTCSKSPDASRSGQERRLFRLFLVVGLSVSSLSLWPVAANAKVEPWARLHDAVQRVRVGDTEGLADELEAVRKQAKADDVDAVVAFLLARVHAKAGRGPEALAAWAKAGAIRTISPPSYAWAETEVLIAAGKRTDALKQLQVFRATWPKLRWAAADLTWSRLAEQQALPDAADIALQLYDKSQLHLPRDELLARAARTTKGGAEAKNLWKRLLMKHPESDYVDEARKHVDPASFSDAEQFERMERLFARRAYERCRDLGLQLWAKGHRKSEVGFYLGKIGSERLRDDYVNAATWLEAAIAVDAPLAQGAMSSYALVLAKLGRTDESVALFDKWLARYPDAPFDKRIEVHYDRARALHVDGRSLEAAKALQGALEVNRGSGIASQKFDFGKYWWFVGYWNHRGGNHADAVSQLATLTSAGNALVGAKARYWTAKSLDKLGKRGEAVTMLAALVRRYPLTYYGALSEDLLRAWGEGKLVPGRADLSKVARRPHDPFAGLPDSKALRRLRLAAHLGEPDAAELVLDDVTPALRKHLGKAKFAALEEDLADVLERYAHRREAAVGKWSGVLSSLPTAATVEKWRAIYPRAYATHVVHAAKRWGAPEWMVYAHMLQESRYKPWLISNAPAYGLLELLDRTAGRLAKEAQEDYQLWMLMVPAHNVRWGTQYLGALYKKFHQQLPFAIGSYNGGPMLFEYHMKVSDKKGVALDEMVDDLGPHESRNYVRMVIGHFLRYLAIYETPKRAAELRDELLPKAWKNAYLPHPNY